MFRIFLKEKMVLVCSAISLALAGGAWVWAYVSLQHVSPPLILHFDSRMGIQAIGHLDDLNGMGLFGILMVLVNSILAITLDVRDRFWGKFIAIGTLLLSTLLFIGFAAIISVN